MGWRNLPLLLLPFLLLNSDDFEPPLNLLSPYMRNKSFRVIIAHGNLVSLYANEKAMAISKSAVNLYIG